MTDFERAAHALLRAQSTVTSASARRVLEAIRNPSDEVLRRGMATHCDPDAMSGDTDMFTMLADDQRRAWQAMIDAILEQGE